jgi:hypothetical protein
VKNARIFWLLNGYTLLLCGCVLSSNAQNPPLNGVWFYTLVNGAQLIEDCPICDHLIVPVPMQGTFQLRFLGQGPLFANYAVENLHFTAEQSGRNYKIIGRGTYRIGGEIGVQQDLLLEATIDDGATNTLCEFTNATFITSRRWPMFQVSLDQTNGTLTRQFHLMINAAPFRELWFSTSTNFNAGIWNAPTNLVSDGDLLASTGRIVKHNGELTAQLGIQPLVPDLGLKDIDILPDGEIVFSTERDVFSETLGDLSAQDLLSERGRIVKHADPDLIKNFQPVVPLAQPVGLQAVQMMDNGQIYFSVQNKFESAKLGVTLNPGDLLSDSGTIVKTGSQLLAPFAPATPNNDYGLKVVYVWPSGEIWFSTRDTFADTNGVSYDAGDLLSDQGYIVYTNGELLSAFSPYTNSANFGLDALFVVSDVVPVISTTFLSVPFATNRPPASLALQRNKGGRVFQLESSTNIAGPFLPDGPITTDSLIIDPGILTNQSQQFYRLHQW